MLPISSSLFPSLDVTYGIGSVERKLAHVTNIEPLNLRHRHGKAFNDHVGIEWLENVSRDQGVVDTGVLVLAEARKVFLPDIYHIDGLEQRRRLLVSETALIAKYEKNGFACQRYSRRAKLNFTIPGLLHVTRH